MNQNSARKVTDSGILDSLLRTFLSKKRMKMVRSYRKAKLRTYSVSGNGVAYRKASDYLRDEKVVDFLEEAEQVRVAR